jgi:rare lipoprotein A
MFMRFTKIFILCAILGPLSFGLTGCSGMWGDQDDQDLPPTSKSQGTFKVGTPYRVQGKKYQPKETYSHSETGIASWYGADFHGKKTANGETYDMNELTAAHRTLQLPSLVRVTNLENGKSLVVRVNDRGPFSKGRVIDVSKRAAELLGFKNKGTAKVRLDLMPEESKAIAMAAKSGQDTSGMEVALNENRNFVVRPITTQPRTPITRASVPNVSQQTLEPIQVSASSSAPAASPSAPPVTGHLRGGDFFPDPVIAFEPVRPTSIYVQTGAFAQQGNAISYAQSLQNLGPARVYPAIVNGQQFYRVRFGPIASVPEADAMLSNLLASGVEKAIIIVDDG